MQFNMLHQTLVGLWHKFCTSKHASCMQHSDSKLLAALQCTHLHHLDDV